MATPPLPTLNTISRRLGSFATLTEALDYAAAGVTGLGFHDGRGQLAHALTYAALRERALALAGRMRAVGLARGERAAIVAETSPDVVTAFCACQYAGLVPALVPLPTAFGGRDTYVEHIRRLTTAARAAALFAPAGLEPWFAPFAGAMGLKAFGTIDALPAAPALAATAPAAVPEDTAYLQFSSGSTRFPVGIAVTHRALMENLRAILTHGLQIRPDDRAVSWLPLYHDMGLVGFLLAPLAGQITVDLLPPQEFARRPQLWLRLLSANRGTLSYSPSFGYELCVRRGRRDGAGPPLDLGAWRIAGIGGDVIRPHVLQRFAEGFGPDGFRAEAFVPSYGMAEATLAISFAPLGSGVATETIDLDRLEREAVAAPATAASRRIRALAFCGTPLPGTEVAIRDPSGAAMGPSRVGRVMVRGPGLMSGYDGHPAESAAVLSDDGWLDTGDLGYLRDGQIVLTGRSKDLIIVNGRNVWPQDLEWSIERALPSVRSNGAAAFAIEEDGVEQVVVLVEVRGALDGAGRERLANEAAGTLRQRHGVEAHVVLVAPGSLPRTSSGKLSRTRARAHYLEGGFGAPASALAPLGR